VENGKAKQRQVYDDAQGDRQVGRKIRGPQVQSKESNQ
jgi:hypothetical protein